VSARYKFSMKSQQKSRALPGHIIIGRKETETTNHVLLKFLGFLLFHRERIQVETNLHMDTIPFVPDLVQLDYELQPKLWVECGDCTLTKLNKLAVKAHEAEIWVIKKSLAEAQTLHQAMAKQKLRRGRYNLIGLDQDMFQEMIDLLEDRNQVVWYQGSFDPPMMQLDFNGLWFDSSFTLLPF